MLEPDRLRIVFAGSPVFAATILEALLARGFRIVAVLTQPDRPAGRSRRPRPTEVKRVAEARGVPVLQPVRLRESEALETLAAHAPDVIAVAAYGALLPPAVLEMPTYGCLNVHASLLPRWRGAAPVERAIMAGDDETGVSIMRMDAGLDTGPVYLRRTCALRDDATGGEVEAELAALGAQALAETLVRLDEPAFLPEPQDDAEATHAPKLTRADAAIDWRRDAAAIARQVRALNPRLPATTAIDGEPLRVHVATALDAPAGGEPGTIVAAGREGIDVACGEGRLRIHRLQLTRGKARVMSAGEALSGHGRRLAVGRRLGDG